MTKRVWSRLRQTLLHYLKAPDDSGAELAVTSLVGYQPRHHLDTVLGSPHISYRDGILIQLAYSIESPGLDATIRQRGARGVAKRLGELFREHHIPAVADAYQNIGKNSTNLARGNFPAFDEFLRWASTADHDQLGACFAYACQQVAATARPVLPMPELDVTRLTFSAMTGLLEQLLATPSEGAHEQFIVAAVLDALMEQNRSHQRVETKRLNASDKSTRTAGDVQVLAGNRIIEAYEITGNDWRTKLEGISQKLREHDLPRIHIIAPIGADSYGSIVDELQMLPDDVSVIDIHGFVASIVSSLTKTYRAHALHRLYAYLDRYQHSIERVNAYIQVLESRNLTIVPKHQAP